jgi:hypothetical protein
MDTRRAAFALALAAAFGTTAAPAAGSELRVRSPHWGSDSAIRLPVADGSLDVSLVPDRGRPLPLLHEGGNRWVFSGPTTALVGESYAIVLHNRTGERLKVVVGVDGLNVYEREVVAGRADEDVGSILAPWSDRTLPGWQIGSHRAQRFVFSPREWSEGEGRTDAQIGLVTVQVYREWRAHAWEEQRDGLHRHAPGARRAEPAPQEQAAPEGEDSAGAARPRAHGAPSTVAPGAPIGTTAGDDVTSSVRTVRFVAATPYPEAWAVLDYGRALPPPRWEPPADDLLGLRVDGDRDGTRIVSVVPGSPADEAGLRPWDVIVRLDTVTRPSAATTRRILESKHPGDYAFVRVRRGSHEIAVKIRG